MKKIILLIFAIITSFGIVSGTSFFTTYQLNFPNEQPSSIFIDGGECVDNSCTTINTNTIELYDANKVNTCWSQYNNNLPAFDNCIIPAKITGNIANLVGTANQIVTKVTTPSTFGYITWFSANGDSYLTMVDRATNYVCNFSTCLDINVANINFQKKANAIATIGQLNIKNIDNPNLPVQITVPVSIDQTVCSAFKFTNPNWFRPSIPQGYSDYSVNTQISLDVSKVSDGSTLTSQSLNIPILADNCAGLGAFSWIAPTGLLNEDVKFKVTSKIIDNQISSSTPDFTQVIEKIFPQNLNGSCYARAFDFTLSNTPTQTMTPSNSQTKTISQIGLTENLFATFTAGAFRDNTQTPMDFEVIMKFNGTVVAQNLFNSGNAIKTYTTDLTNDISNVTPGSYDVELSAKPIGNSCTNTAPVVLNQNLQILEAQNYDVAFHVTDVNGNFVSSSLVNLELLNLNENYPRTITYSNSVFTNNSGTALFNNIQPGIYKYTITKNGIGKTSNTVNITSNSDIYVTINNKNVAPIVALPTQIRGYYLNPIKINLKDYVIDYDNAFNELNFTGNIISGNVNIGLDSNGIVTITTSQIGTAQIKINAFDPSGAVGTGTVSIDFTNNAPAIINTFNVLPNNGQAPFNAKFNVDVNPVDGDSLSCTLNFGDGTTVSTTGNCAPLNGLVHTYKQTGSYKAILSIDDGSNPILKANQMIYVYNRTGPSPQINSFTLTSSNGLITPTNLLLNWNVVHTGGWPMTCSLRYNSVSTNVPCVGSQSINNYNIPGTSRFTIIAIDNASTQVLRTIPLTLTTTKINLFNTTSLIMDDVIVPGDFKFKIAIAGEKYNRNIKLSPSIVCNNVENKYKTNQLDSTITSTINNLNYKEYEIFLNTNDFNLLVPTEISCQFKVLLVDNLGFSAVKTKTITFSYPAQITGIKSIRGKGTDIVNFMNSALSTSFITGYNSIDFIVKNNEDVGKKLSISFSSADLGINYQLDDTLTFGSERRVQIPIFISKDIKPGKYPVRISVYDGTNRQSRYTYINIQ